MSKQRNEPSDPSALLAGYDFSKSDGHGVEDGDVSTMAWPSNIKKEDFNQSGLEIVPKWVNSQYTEPTMQNIKDFSESVDNYVEATVRINVLKANQEKLKEGHLKDSERFCIAILAYEQMEDLGKLEGKYPISRESLRRARYAFDNIIEARSGDITKEKMDSETERYMNSTSRAVAEGVQEKGESENKEFITTATQETKKADKQTKSEMIVVKLELEKTTAKEVILNDQLPSEISEQIVESILKSVGL